MSMVLGKVLIITGSDSDLPIMKGATDFFKSVGVDYEIHVSSAHRAPAKTEELAKNAKANGFDCIIAAAGLAAHLPGVVAAQTTLPVIGVPIKSGALAGVDALYAVVQMPPGIPVATVAIDGARNAAVLATQIIGVKNEAVSEKLVALKEKMAIEVENKDIKLQELGIDGYLNK